MQKRQYSNDSDKNDIGGNSGQQNKEMNMPDQKMCLNMNNFIKNQRLKPMIGLGNNRMNHYNHDIKNQRLFGNP